MFLSLGVIIIGVLASVGYSITDILRTKYIIKGCDVSNEPYALNELYMFVLLDITQMLSNALFTWDVLRVLCCNKSKCLSHDSYFCKCCGKDRLKVSVLQVCLITPRAHARARGYVIGRGVHILYIVWTFFGTNLLSPKILTLRCLF